MVQNRGGLTFIRKYTIQHKNTLLAPKEVNHLFQLCLQAKPPFIG